MIEQKCIEALEQGKRLVKKGKYEKAISLYLQTVIEVQENIESKMTSNTPRACWKLYSETAELCSIEQKGTSEDIQQLYTSAFTLCLIAANNNNIQAKHDLGFMYYCGTGIGMDYQKAIEWLESAAADPVPCDRTYCTLARIYQSLGDMQKAEFYFEKVQNFGIYIPPTPKAELPPSPKAELPKRFPQFMGVVKKSSPVTETTSLLRKNKHVPLYGLN